jgi:transaldolase
MEVEPGIAYDTERTFDQARWIAKEVDRPNLYVKIPATMAGLPAIRQSLAAGININITLLFAVEMYEAVIGAYLDALEDRVRTGRDIAALRSVASFFVSRVDSEVDKRLTALNKPAQTDGLMGKAAIANAKLAYELYVKHFEGRRFRDLMAKGAAVQRPLWASTGTKNPKYKDTMYVDELIGPDTVNTMPPATLDAFADHGTVDRTVDRDVDQAKRQLAAIDALGIRLSDVTDLLVEEGVKKFEESFASLLKTIDEKKARLASSSTR